MRAMPHGLTNSIANVVRFVKTNAAPLIAVASFALIAF